MKFLKRISLSIIGFLLVLTGVFFVGCGEKDYSSLSLTCDVSQITLDIDQTETLYFKLEKYSSGMSGRLAFSKTDENNSVLIEEGDPKGGVTPVIVTGLRGGSAKLRAVSLEGNKECVVTINVRQYSNGLSATDERLFVSNSRTFTPAPSHFTFDKNVTETELKYYFYGTVAAGIEGRPLELQDVRDVSGDYIKEFVSVQLQEVIQDSKKNYLVFTDSKGAKYTLDKNTQVSAHQNVAYNLIPLSQEGGEYDFSGALEVGLGNKFTFVAVYDNQTLEQSEIFAQRDFYVMPDIEKDKIGFTYGYPVGNDIYPSYNNDKVVLVPNREQEMGQNTILFNGARLSLNLPSAGSGVKVGYDIEDDNVANIRRLETEENIFEFEISNKSSIEARTNIVFKIYYDGFENVDDNDSGVSYKLVVPVEIKFQPKEISVLGSERTFVLYNNYSGYDYGWKNFNLYINPSTASYSGVMITFNPKQVRIRYNGNELISDLDVKSVTFTINDLTKPLEIKGKDGADTTIDETVKFTVLYNMFDNEINDLAVEGELHYRITSGATSLNFKNPFGYDFATQGIYISAGSNGEIFEALEAEGTFESVDFSFVKPTSSNDQSRDVVNITYDSSIKDGVVRMKIVPKQKGYGTYTVRLDNGLSRQVTFYVIETLDRVTVDYGSDSSAITKLSQNGNETELYILNSARNENGALDVMNASIKILANGVESSTAMIVDKFSVDRGPSSAFDFSFIPKNVFDSQGDLGTYFEVFFNTNGDGNAIKNFTVYGWGVENFRQVETKIECYVNVVCYSLIEKLNIYKTQDGNGFYTETAPANNVNVYRKTNNVSPRTGVLNSGTRYNGYFFMNPLTGQFMTEQFSSKFVYWTAPGVENITCAGKVVDRMVNDTRTGANNIYTIGSYGTFDTQSMTFTAFQTATSNFNFYLIAHIEQYERSYSFPVRIIAKEYKEVTALTVQTDVTDNMLNFSGMTSKRKKNLIVYTSPEKATNSTIVVVFKPKFGQDENGNAVPILLFGDYDNKRQQYTGITLNQQADKVSWILSLDVSSFVESPLSKSNNVLSGELVIAAADWVDSNGNVRNEYATRAIYYTVNFGNGTVENPHYLESTQDVLDMKNALSAHYRLATSIDMSGQSESMPLGVFSGSLIGVNDYAKISGIVINKGKENADENTIYYGLFSKVTPQIKDGEKVEGTGLIEGVDFEGNIQIANAAADANIALVTAVNEGTLRNLGVTVSADSNISLSGNANIGLVAGKNTGLIIQDYTYIRKDLDNDGNVMNTISLSPKILVYMKHKLEIIPKAPLSNTAFADLVFAGGVVGYNIGSIVKTDNPDLKLYGYSQYLAYTQITIARNVGITPLICTGTDFSAVGGLVGFSASGSKIFGQGYGETYNFGDGILVGGRVEGPGYVGGVVGRFVGKDGNRLLASEDGTSQTLSLEFDGITSRTFVVGQGVEGLSTAIGAITGRAEGVKFNNELSWHFAVQAIDSGESGLNSSMIIRYHPGTNTPRTEWNEIKNSKFLNTIAFGYGGSLYDFIKKSTADEKGNIVHYLDRIDMTENKPTTENITISSPGSKNEFYGNYVEVINTTNGLQAARWVTFDKDNENWKVEKNENFAAFEKDGKTADNVFYGYFFKAAGVEYSDKTEDVLDAQLKLNEKLNTVVASSELYPIVASNGLILTSQNPEILTINQSGGMTFKDVGLAKVEVSSILNQNSTKVIYVQVQNYFNSNKNLYVVYPDTSEDSVPVDVSTITIRGTNSVSLYVRPDYSLSYGEEVADNQGTGVRKIEISKEGLARVGGMTIRLAPNTAVIADVAINYYLEFENSAVFDSLDEQLKQLKMQLDEEQAKAESEQDKPAIDSLIKQIETVNQKIKELQKVGNTKELDIDINGQTVSFGKNDNTREGIYQLIIRTKIVAQVPNGDANNNKFDVYEAFVNTCITDTKLVYTKGAESISHTEYDELTIASSREGEDIIQVNSPTEEENPKYVIYRLNKNNDGTFTREDNPFQGTYEALVDPTTDLTSLFSVKFDKQTKAGIIGNQIFLLNISVNKGSRAYTDRHLNNIYGKYRIYIYAESDTSIYTTIDINLVNYNVNNVTINNYSDISRVEESRDFSNNSDKAVPGKTGLLIINITPDDADFDYVEIVNTSIAEQAGNGKASFSLLTRRREMEEGKNMFEAQTISGSSILNGIRLYQRDIVNLYNKTIKDEGGNDIFQYENYNGIIYLSYEIATMGVVNESQTQFAINIYKDGEIVYTPAPVVTLTNYLSYQAYVTLDGKNALEENDNSQIYKTYHVARGLKYRLNLDYFGFSFDNITLTTSHPESARITYENGSYYLQISADPFDYTQSSEDGFPISIFVNANQVVDEEPRSFTSTTKVRVLEYVIDYDYDKGDKSLLDIVSKMDQGVINVQISNPQKLDLDLVNLIEFDQTNASVVDKVVAFMHNLTEGGTWTAYTNLNSSGLPDFVGNTNSMRVTTTSYNSSFKLNEMASNPQNAYFKWNGLDVTPIVTHDYEDSYYMFSYDGYYTLDGQSGIYRPVPYSANIAYPRVYTEFKFNVYQSSSEKSPIPIENYDQLMNMYSGAYYILMKDIELDLDFKPITTEIASFDGNGHSIILNGDYMVSGSNVGLFASVPTDTVIKNLNVKFGNEVTFTTDSTSLNFGLIAGQNDGNITNCSVDGNGYTLIAKCSTDLASDSYVAGLVGQNGGNITNCRTSVNINGSFSTAGLVGVNSGKIASSYFKEGKLNVVSGQAQHVVGGLVVTNNEGGQIITSYVSGSTEQNLILSMDGTNIITGASKAAGFVFSNRGTIRDCYSNIQIDTRDEGAGFVYENGGTVQNCFSLSRLKDERLSSAGFAMSNNAENGDGEFINCYYFFHNSTGSSDIMGNINTSLETNFEGIVRLDETGFADLATYFDQYSYSDGPTNYAVWFYSADGAKQEMFKDVTKEADNSYFNSGRLELVAPNIIACSRQRLVGTLEEENGDVHYEYSYAADPNDPSFVAGPALGSIKNPYILRNVETMEGYLIEPATMSGFNFENYRIVADIDYSDYDGLSQLYGISLAGSLEGNGMTISQISLLSQNVMQNAGMFAQIGRDVNNKGTVMNLTISPREVNFTNTSCVGALAGTLTYGYVYNVRVETEDELVVTGKNFAGGLIGRAVGDYKIKNVYSNLSAVASYRPIYNQNETDPENANSYSVAMSDLTKFSYAGSVIGFVGGDGVLERISTSGVANVMADRAGMAIGGIGSNAEVNYLFVTVSEKLYVKAQNFGGIAVGEIKGKLNYVNVSGTNKMQEVFPLSENVPAAPTVPMAVGGIVGLLNGGSINEAYAGVGLNVPQKANSNLRVGYVGGIAGRVVGDSNISKAIVAQDLDATSGIVGGVAGFVGGALKIDQVAVQAEQISVHGQLSGVSLGGIIGATLNNFISITNTYTTANLKVESYVYGMEITAEVGPFVGSGTPNKMSYCYSTGKTDVKLEDKRNSSGATRITTLKDGKSIVDGKVDEKITYTKNLKSVGYDNVFYYGFNETNPDNLDFYKEMLTYSACSYRESVSFVENVQGVSSYKHATDNSYQNRFDKNVLNDIFDTYYLSTNLTAVSPLKTEYRYTIVKKEDNTSAERFVQTNNFDNYYEKKTSGANAGKFVYFEKNVEYENLAYYESDFIRKYEYFMDIIKDDEGNDEVIIYYKFGEGTADYPFFYVDDKGNRYEKNGDNWQLKRGSTFVNGVYIYPETFSDGFWQNNAGTLPTLTFENLMLWRNQK